MGIEKYLILLKIVNQLKHFIFQTLCFCLPITALYNSNSAIAQTSLSASSILHELEKLNTIGSVMYVAAHPDDENTRLLSWLANERHLNTVYVSLTRGDGGQNLIGSEQGDLLGLIRTEELLAARRVDGAEQWFTRAVDFGYSKNPEETFDFWNKDNILEDLVFAIRKFKPDVIITRFPTTGEGGHGHHTASAILAGEAFKLAADPNAFVHQLKFVEIWQAGSLYWNTFNFGSTNTTSEDQLKVDVGTFNPLLGKSYGELAASSRSMHKSQGFGSAMQRGSQTEYFKYIAGNKAKSDLFETVDLSWNRINGAKLIEKQIQNCLKLFDPLHPEKSISNLVKLYQQINGLDENDPLTRHYKKIKLKKISDIIVASAGLWFETSAAHYIAVPGKPLELTSKVILRNKTDIELLDIAFEDGTGDTLVASLLKQNQMFNFKRKFVLPASWRNNDPYWLKNTGSAQGFSHNKIGSEAQMNEYGIAVYYRFKVNGLILAFEQAVKYKYTDPVKGEIYRPLEILPPVTLTPGEQVLVIGSNGKAKVHYLLKANADNISGKFVIEGGLHCHVNFKDSNFYLAKKGDELLIEAEISECRSNYTGYLRASAIVENKIWSFGLKRVEYDHIPVRYVLVDEPVKIIHYDIKTSGRKIAYIPGAGDNVAACIQQLGYEVTLLGNEEIKTADLSIYDAVVTGVRAFNTNDKLYLYHDKLMDYVKNGGRLIVQYNTNSRVGPLQTGIGPYKFSISRNRVTNEKSDVSFVDDSNVLLNYPNKIDKSDFDFWVQERGVYFASELDSAYQTVLKMNDPNEAQDAGSLIMTHYGKGVFIYTGLSFFRQLPAGVPGAYRLFVNLLSVPVK